MLRNDFSGQKCGRMIEHPPGRGLRKVDGAGLGLVGEEVTESSPLKGSIRRNVEGVGLTKESLQFESFEIGLCR
jgi:hypothetical protein